MMRRDGRRMRRGMSLVEILVVLVVLAIGILAVVRLFPEGFQTINYGANVTMAHGLVKQNEDYMRDRQASLPDAIVGVVWDPATNQGRISNTYNPKILVPYDDNPINGFAGAPSDLPEDMRRSYVNSARRVLGESFRIPPPTQNVVLGGGAEVSSLYRATFSPFYSAVPAGGYALGVQAYSGTPARRIVIGRAPQDPQEWSDLADSIADPFSYAIDYESGRLYFHTTVAPNTPGYERRFRIQVRYRVVTGNTVQMLQAPIDSCIYLPIAKDGDDPTTAEDINDRIQVFNLRTGPVTAPPAGSPPCPFTPIGGTLDRDTEQLYRVFTQIAPGTRFDPGNYPDVYQFKVYDTLGGLLGFHPGLASVAMPRQEGSAPTVRIDYDVDDWHILREDLVAPTVDPQNNQGFHVIKLGTGSIKKIGDVEDTLTFLGPGGGGVDTTFEYQGLVRHYPAGGGAPERLGTPRIDVVVLDLQSGAMINNQTLDPTGANGNASNGEIDYEAGIIRLRTSIQFEQPGGADAAPVVMSPGGRHLRVYYRTYNDTAVASFKPQSTFFNKPYDPAMRLGPQEFAQYPNGYLLFPPSEAEKSVTVDYAWSEGPGTGRPGAPHTEIGELHRLKPPSHPAAPGVPGYWWLRVGHAYAASGADSEADPDVAPGSIRIDGVRGASFHTHVMWRQGTRWRHLERTTVLTRSGR